eukprot:gene6219-6857_t
MQYSGLVLPLLLLCLLLPPINSWIAFSSHSRYPLTSTTTTLLAKKSSSSSSSSNLPKPEFSRPLNIAQIPLKRPVLCRILAKESERQALAHRLDLSGLSHFSANVTVGWQDLQRTTLFIEGTIEAHMSAEMIQEDEVIKVKFDSTVYNGRGGGEGEGEEEEEVEHDCDEEVDSQGNIDIGEIASQYLAMEL